MNRQQILLHNPLPNIWKKPLNVQDSTTNDNYDHNWKKFSCGNYNITRGMDMDSTQQIFLSICSGCTKEARDTNLAHPHFPFVRLTSLIAQLPCPKQKKLLHLPQKQMQHTSRLLLCTQPSLFQAFV